MERVRTFWDDEIRPFTDTSTVILVITHPGPMFRLGEYLKSQGYSVLGKRRDNVLDCSGLVHEISLTNRTIKPFGRTSHQSDICEEVQMTPPNETVTCQEDISTEVQGDFSAV
jgi:hypothetical protein